MSLPYQHGTDVRRAQSMAIHAILGQAGRLDSWVCDIKKIADEGTGRLDEICREVDRSLNRAEGELQTVLRREVFEPLGFAVPNQPGAQDPIPPTVLADRAFEEQVNEFMVFPTITHRATENGALRFTNVVQRSNPSTMLPAGTLAILPRGMLTYQTALEIVQFAIGQDRGVCFELLGVPDAGLVNLRVRKLLDQITLAYAKKLVLARVRMLHELNGVLPAELASMVLNQLVPQRSGTFCIGINGVAHSYTQAHFPTADKIEDSLPSLRFDLLPGWPFVSNDVIGWDRTLAVSLVHLLDEPSLRTIAISWYQAIQKVFVWGEETDAIDTHNVFGMQFAEPRVLLGRDVQIEAGWSVHLPRAGDDGPLDQETGVRALARILRSKTHPYSTATERDLDQFDHLSITVKFYVGGAPGASPADILAAMDTIVAMLDSVWATEYPDFARSARKRIKVRFWVVPYDIDEYTFGGDTDNLDYMLWEELCSGLRGAAAATAREVKDDGLEDWVEDWLSYVVVDTVRGWAGRLAGPHRSSILPAELVAKLPDNLY